MKNLNYNQMESLQGGLCVSIPGSTMNGQCLPCPAFLAILGGGLAGGLAGGPPICIA